MSDLQKKLGNIIEDIEKNLSNKEEIEFVKKQIYSIYSIFMEEFDNLEAKTTDQMENILIRCKIMEDKMNDMKESINKIESDIYIKENEDYDFNITCPYCTTDFFIDLSEEEKDSVICPECNKEIELDWDDNDECSHNCHDCGKCSDDDCDEDDDM